MAAARSLVAAATGAPEAAQAFLVELHATEPASDYRGPPLAGLRAELEAATRPTD